MAPKATEPKAKPIAASSPPIAFEVLGTPAPKGSSRAILIAGRAVNVPGSSNVGRTKIKAWASAVRERALELVGDRSSPPFVGTPLEVAIEFRLTRPAGHYGTGKRAGEIKASAPVYPQGKPDADKLVRTTLDALTGAVFDDDSRIVRMSATKVYARPGREGAEIRISEMGRPPLAIVRSPEVELARLGDGDEVIAPRTFPTAENADHEVKCPCALCQADRDRVGTSASARGRENIRKILDGGPAESLAAFGRSHARAKHVRPQTELERAAAAGEPLAAMIVIGRKILDQMDADDDFGGPDL